MFPTPLTTDKVFFPLFVIWLSILSSIFWLELISYPYKVFNFFVNSFL
jgi:hypothetical protein